jgi:hypothetical protein
MVSVEPVMNFDLSQFLTWFRVLKPEFVSVGADSGRNSLPEPSSLKLANLLRQIELITEVRKKANLCRLLEKDSYGMLSQDKREKRLEWLETEKDRVKRALDLKELGGSVVWEKLACGKPACNTCEGYRPAHGPNAYLHFYDSSCPWKVRKRYLGNIIGELLCCPKTELEERLKDLESEQRKILG